MNKRTAKEKKLIKVLESYIKLSNHAIASYYNLGDIIGGKCALARKRAYMLTLDMIKSQESLNAEYNNVLDREGEITR